MTVAIPTFGTRVAPTFLHCETMQLARLLGEKVVSLETVSTDGLTEDERIKLLEDRKVSVLVCGGIGRELAEELRNRGIDVLHNVAGEAEDVLARVARGEIRSGYGISHQPDVPHKAAAIRAPREIESEGPAIDCIACANRLCLQGQSCPHSAAAPLPKAGNPGLRQALEVTMDIAAEPERILCRISELVYFCLGMDYEHVGLAFCADLFGETEIIAQLLMRFVRVTPVCCRVYTSSSGSTGSPADNGSEQRCNPAEMARILNNARTDLNILIGLCMGSDVIFTQLSHAPVTTLFVKDRLLANNPIAAVHSRYVLDQVISET